MISLQDWRQPSALNAATASWAHVPVNNVRFVCGFCLNQKPITAYAGLKVQELQKLLLCVPVRNQFGHGM